MLLQSVEQMTPDGVTTGKIRTVLLVVTKGNNKVDVAIL